MGMYVTQPVSAHGMLYVMLPRGMPAFTMRIMHAQPAGLAGTIVYLKALRRCGFKIDAPKTVKAAHFKSVAA